MVGQVLSLMKEIEEEKERERESSRILTQNLSEDQRIIRGANVSLHFHISLAR